jgi:hypothetical protein
MKNTVTRVFRYLAVGLALQQLLYGMRYGQWIDFSEFSSTTILFELIYIGYLISSAISESAIGPMKFKKREQSPENYFTPTKH